MAMDWIAHLSLIVIASFPDPEDMLLMEYGPAAPCRELLALSAKFALSTFTSKRPKIADHNQSKRIPTTKPDYKVLAIKESEILPRQQ